MFKKLILLVVLIVFAQSVQASENVLLDCDSFDRNVRADFIINKDSEIHTMRLLDYRTNYYSVVPIYRVRGCFRDEVCYRGKDRFYNFEVSFPKEILSEDRPDSIRTFSTLTARHRRNIQYFRITLSCISF